MASSLAQFPGTALQMELYVQTTFHTYHKRNAVLRLLQDETTFRLWSYVYPTFHVAMVFVVTKAGPLAGRLCPRARQSTLTRCASQQTANIQDARRPFFIMDELRENNFL